MPALLALGLTACVVGPDYEEPTRTIPDAWQTGTTEAVEVTEWWLEFGDAKLTELIEESVAKNLDLRAALARIDEARAVYGITSGRRIPDVNATGSYSRGKNSEASLGFPTADASNYDVGLTASWEIDLFGHVRRSIEAARADYESVIASFRGVLVSLHADVAEAYVNVRLNQRRIAIARSNFDSQGSSLTYVKNRHDAGAASGLDLAQAESNVASTEASIPPLEDSLTRSIHRLAVLVDKPFGVMRAELEESAPLPSTSVGLTAGLPSELLRRRPDVQQAERTLAAETARVGIQEADLYPRLDLAASFGLQSLHLDDLTDSGARRFAVTPSLLWNLFDGGRERGDIKAQEARVRQAVANYEQTVLFALEDVEAALSSGRRDRERVEALSRAVDAYRRSSELSGELYRAGEADFQNVLDAQRNLLNFEDQMAVSEANVVLDVIALYLALGGSWEPTPETNEAQQ